MLWRQSLSKTDESHPSTALLDAGTGVTRRTHKTLRLEGQDPYERRGSSRHGQWLAQQFYTRPLVEGPIKGHRRGIDLACCLFRDPIIPKPRCGSYSEPQGCCGASCRPTPKTTIHIYGLAYGVTACLWREETNAVMMMGTSKYLVM